MVFRDIYEKENILWKFVDYETIALYEEGVEELKNQGYEILGIVADGRRGIFKAFSGTPIQMCQFHQKQIVRRYLSDHPILPAGIELKEIVSRITITDRESFAFWLDQWFLKWRNFLNEKTIDFMSSKQQFTHRRLRGAYYSLRHNLSYLFTYHQYLKIGMPNTTNSLDGTFSHLKTKVRVHRGLKLHRKKKLIKELLTKK